MEKNSRLAYTGENKSFRYTDGDCVSTGSMLVDNGIFTCVENGNVSKNGKMKNIWMNMARSTNNKINYGSFN